MKRAFSALLIVLFAGGILIFTGCGKGDKTKIITAKNKFTEFMKTDEYKKIMDDPSACGKKMEEYVKAAGFKDYMEYIKASQKLMSDPDITKIDAEQMKLNDSIKAAKPAEKPKK
jgi:hypothetical protein